MSKTFGAHTVLRDFELTIQSGEIHVLVGENGSGKSTLIKALSGYHHPDLGSQIEIGGEPLTFGSATESHNLGARFVHQDLALIDTASVLDNLSLGVGYPSRLGTIRGRAARTDAAQLLRRVGLDIDPTLPLGQLSPAERTGVAVARALRTDPDHPPRLLVLDEPTATLPTDEVDRLLEIVRTAASSGVGILFVTHHLDEVFRVADRVTVLRDGRQISTSPIAELDRPTLVAQLVGDQIEDVLRSHATNLQEVEPALVVNSLRAEAIDGISFAVKPGEILGFAGLTGSGREALLGAVFGATKRAGGDVAVRGKSVRADHPELAIAQGMAYLPPDRKSRSGLMSMSARDNLTLADLRPFKAPGRLVTKRENAEAADWFSRLDVRPRGQLHAVLSSFSGGNQQKVLLGKWMRLRPAVFLLDEPTQGVDIGAKAEVHRQLLSMAAQQTALVVASTDIEELVTLCDRVLILRHGRVVDELSGDQIRLSEIKGRTMQDTFADDVVAGEVRPS